MERTLLLLVTGLRRDRWKATPVPLVPVTVDGEVRLVPRTLERTAERGLLP